MSKRVYATSLTEADVDRTVLLKGWVQKRRDLGGLIFIDLRDKSGVIQIVFNPDISEQALQIANQVRNEYVIAVQGEIVKRAEETTNPKMKTGRSEVIAKHRNRLNKAKRIHMLIDDDEHVS